MKLRKLDEIERKLSTFDETSDIKMREEILISGGNLWEFDETYRNLKNLSK